MSALYPIFERHDHGSGLKAQSTHYCAGCGHGLAHKYLARAIEEYRNGGRKNPIMKGFAGNLKDDDIGVIAAYYSALTPGLQTEPRPQTFLTEKH